MRLAVFTVGVAGILLAGCVTGRGGTGIPDEEATYDLPLEEVWPSVRQFFTDNGLPFREDKGSFVLETEWREEFGGSRVSGFWHRYMVLGKRDTPTDSKLWIIRITRSANKTLQDPGDQLDWGTSRSLGGADGAESGGGGGVVEGEGGLANNSIEDMSAFMAQPQGENAIVAGSAQGQRDLVMEWKVFHGIAPQLAKIREEHLLKESSPGQMVVQAPKLRSAPVSLVAIECGMPIIGLTPQAKRGGVMMLGELHGTQEVPRFVAQSACQVASAGTPMTVGLELPVENQERVSTFIRSAGTDEDWLKLMEAPFWRSPFPDGRSSEGMANLLEQLRRLRIQGLEVDAFVFDHPKLAGQERENAMAATVLSYVRKGPDRFFMVVAGNVHPRTAQGVPWDKKYRPMGMQIAEEVDETIALDMAYNSGTAWICAVGSRGEKLECGVKDTQGKDNGDRYFVHLWSDEDDNGFHGVFYVGPVTASLPAVRRGLGRPGADDNSVHPYKDPKTPRYSSR
ncbi:hypothetical protein [Hyalangium sp.]|uniref:hypothetical protein n=1 Tax=Hyalangium sp. TaxID=2028555 RepID=UPI002D4CD272|nr:hypothetical protein [Hyalangium sp.]HYH97729.1 hypothetical protein [Hyalangium sp.]